MSCDCEFKRYHSFEYLSGDTRKRFPFVVAPYHVRWLDVMICPKGVELCVLTMEREKCDAEHKECCSHYKKHLERLSRPKIPCMWNSETKRREYGIPVDYNNWNM